MSRLKMVRSFRFSGTSPRTMRCASPSAMAVLPTPASPIRQGLFLRLRDRMRTTLRISWSRPITGSSFLLARQLHQVLAVLFQYVVGVFGVVAGDPLAPARWRAAPGTRSLDAEAAQHLAHGGAGLFDEAEKYVFHADVLVLHGGGAFFGGRQHLVGGLGDIDLIRLAAGTGHMGQGRHLLAGRRGKAARFGPQLFAAAAG